MFRSLALITVAGMFGVRADTIGPGSCGSCLGNSYTLEYSNLSQGTTNTTLDVFLIINSSGFNGLGTGANIGVGDILDAAVKIVSGNSTDVVSANLLAAPGGAGNWTTAIGGENGGGGCSSSNGGFICSAANFGSETDADLGGTLTFEWAVTVKNGKLDTNTLGSSVKATFYCEDGTTEGCHPGTTTSENITLQQSVVPEPRMIALLLVGLLSLCFVQRRLRTESR